MPSMKAYLSEVCARRNQSIKESVFSISKIIPRGETNLLVSQTVMEVKVQSVQLVKRVLPSCKDGRFEKRGG